MRFLIAKEIHNITDEGMINSGTLSKIRSESCLKKSLN